MGGLPWPGKWMSLSIKMNEFLMPESLWKTQADQRVPIQAYRVTLRVLVWADMLISDKNKTYGLNEALLFELHSEQIRQS